jgi:cell division protein FtsW
MKQLIRRLYDSNYGLIITSLVLLCFGLLMVYSSSGVAADDSFYYVKKQLVFSMIGFILFMFFLSYDYMYLRRWSRILLFVSFIMLVAVLFIGRERSGALRWLKIGPFNFQPSELAKFSIVIYLADYLDRRKSKIKDFTRGILRVVLVVGVISVLIAVEPDLGTPAVIIAVTVVMLFVSGAKLMHLANIFLVLVPVFVWAIFTMSYRRARFLAFLNPWEHTQDTAYQLIQSLLSLGSGGIIGRGFGQSELKNFYLPGQHTDFIFSVVGEELGIVGTVLIVGLFTYFFILGYKIAKHAPDFFSRLLALGITLLISLQAFFNIAVCCGCLPTKGISLPFISYGGSSLVVTLAAIGILSNISQHIRKT